MASKKKRVIRGAASSIVEDQPSFADDTSRRGKHFTVGRKVVDLDHVGALSPDTDDPSDDGR
jgi:hypothetical protein